MIRNLPAALTCAIALLAPAAPAQAAQPRVIGGSDAQIEDYAYQVIVIVNGAFCGGSIRDATHVITAAHCVIDDSSPYPQVSAPGAGVFVAYGTDDISAGFEDTVGVSTISVDRRYLRRLVGREYDSAVLTLSAPIDLDDPSAPADALPPANAVAGSTATATGFGSTAEGGNISDTLQVVDVPFVDDTSCAGSYGSELVAAAMICAGAEGRDTCQGDSGGPLVVGSGVGRRLAGITSFGEGCGRRGFPGVYTEVTEPGTRAFVSSGAPAAPPAVTNVEPTVTGEPRVGATVTCSPPAVAGSTPAQYFFYSFDGATFTGIGSGSSSTLTVPESAVGQRLNCDVRYENDGGFAYAVSSRFSGVVTAPGPASPGTPAPPGTPIAPGTPVAPVTPPGPTNDRTRPRSRITRVRCRGRSCVISISASDASPGVIGSVRVTLSHRRRVCRRRSGRRACRTRVVKKRLRAGAFRAGRYRAVALGLTPRRYRVTAVATDTAGNRQVGAAARSFTVKRRR